MDGMDRDLNFSEKSIYLMKKEKFEKNWKIGRKIWKQMSLFFIFHLKFHEISIYFKIFHWKIWKMKDNQFSLNFSYFNDLYISYFILCYT